MAHQTHILRRKKASMLQYSYNHLAYRHQGYNFGPKVPYEASQTPKPNATQHAKFHPRKPSDPNK